MAVTDITSLFAEGGSYAIVGAGMMLAYRLTRRAHNESVEVYRRAVADSDTRIAVERARWDAERLGLLARIAQLEGRSPAAGESRAPAAETPNNNPPQQQEGQT